MKAMLIALALSVAYCQDFMEVDTMHRTYFNAHAMSVNRKQAVASPSDCVARCHRILDANRSVLDAKTYPSMLDHVDTLCPVQYETTECATNCPYFPGKTMLIAKINYVGFLCDNKKILDKYRICYSSKFTDKNVNQCSGDCALNLLELTEQELKQRHALLKRSCELNKCKNNCIYNLIYNHCGNSTFSKLEAASLITRWLANDYKVERLDSYAYELENNTVTPIEMPSECNWVKDAIVMPAALRSMKQLSLPSTILCLFSILFLIHFR